MSTVVVKFEPKKRRNLSSRQWTEVVVTLGMIMLALWVQRAGRGPYIWFAVIWLAATTFIYDNRWRNQFGQAFRWPGCWRPLWLPCLTAVIFLVFTLGAVALGTDHYPKPPATFLWRFGRYALWAGLQQVLALLYLFPRFEKIFGSGKIAALATALAFTAVHFPNPILMLATLIGGAVLTVVYNQYRSIYWPIIVHAVIGFAITFSLPMKLHHGMRVGLTYLSYK